MKPTRSFPIIFVLLILLSILSIMSCSDDAVSTPSDPSVGIIPLKTGNSWTFLTTFYDTVGVVKFTNEVKETIYGDTSIAGTKWFYPSTTHDIMVTNLTDGYHWREQFVGGSGAEEMLVWKYPAVKGDFFPYAGVSVFILSTSEVVTVPAGTFDCYHYWSTYRNAAGDTVTGHMDAWLSPNIGMVKVEGYLKKTSGEEYRNYKQELTAYTLK